MEQTNDRSALAARVRIRRAQKVWKFLRDVNNTSLSDLNRVALEDGAHSYTYGLMFREWERYASVFSALGMTGEAHSRVGLLGSTCVETIFALYGLNIVGADVNELAPMLDASGASTAVACKVLRELILSINT